MRRVRLIPSLALLAAAAGCSPPPARDIAYYRTHPVERAARMTACRGDRGRLAATADCINALAADSEATSRRFWASPAAAPRVKRSGAL